MIAIVVARRRSRLGDEAGRPLLAAPMRPLRDFVARRFNPFVVRWGLVGGRRSPWALIEHVGRRSGTTYRTPILPRRIPGGFEIPLPYGADAQWVQNVHAAGRARLQVHETICELGSPEIVGAAEARSLRRYERWAAVASDDRGWKAVTRVEVRTRTPFARMWAALGSSLRSWSPVD